MPPRRIRMIKTPAPRAGLQQVKLRRAGLPIQALRPAPRRDVAHEKPLDAPETQAAPQSPGNLAPVAAQGGGTATQGTQRNTPWARRQPVKRRRAGLPIQAMRPAPRWYVAYKQPLAALETQAAPQSPGNLAPGAAQGEGTATQGPQPNAPRGRGGQSHRGVGRREGGTRNLGRRLNVSPVQAAPNPHMAPGPTRGGATMSPGRRFTAINVPRTPAAPSPQGPTWGGGMLNRGPEATPFPNVVPPGPVQGTLMNTDGQVLPRVEAQRRVPPSPDTIRFGMRRNPPARGSSEEGDH
jgi:hypothetical protein